MNPPDSLVSISRQQQATLEPPLSPAAAPALSIDPAVLATHGLERAGFYERFGKRMIDVIGASLLLVLTAPILLLAMIGIKLDSRGPLLFRSERCGKNGRHFNFYKLRTMYNGSHAIRHTLMHLNEMDGPVFKLANDPRITPFGRILRRASIDELPQLWNVLRGHMSLVGPRPPIPEEVSQYSAEERRRLTVKPGLTCFWQVSGRSTLGFSEWVRLDIEYIRQRSFLLDLKILLLTIPAVLSGRGAY